MVVPGVLFRLILSLVWSLGLSMPVPNCQTDNGTSDDYEWTISDEIEKANKGVLTGDIRLRMGRNALICNSCQWDKSNKRLAIVPYVLSSEYTDINRDLITSAMLEFTTMSCVHFKARDTESDYLSFENGQGCWSFMGRLRGRQTLNIKQYACMNYGRIQHEIMHALGFYHEHNRLDRDNYVDINWKFISPEDQGNFKLEDGNPIDLHYDYTSVMHYGSYSYVNTTGQRSIMAKLNQSIQLGQTTGLSSLDVKRINLLYNCNLCRTKLLGASGKFSSSDAAPINDIDNCLWLLHVPSKLILLQFIEFVCLSNKCNAKINVYDGVSITSPLLATIRAGQPLPVLISSGRLMLLEYITNPSTPSSFSASYSSVLYGGSFTIDGGSVESPHYPSNYPNNANGTYIIIAPPGNRVSLTFRGFDIESSPKCVNDYLEIRDGGDLNARLLGVYCGRRSNLVVASSGPMVILQFFCNSIINRKGFKANYSFVSTR